jgi:hypothetical protein
MEAIVGSNAPFGRGCEPLKVLAGLEVTAKAIERTAETIGAEIARREQHEIVRAKQLVLPATFKQSIPKLYVLMDGTGVPVVLAETQGRSGKIEGQRAHTRECKLGCVFTQTTVDKEGRPIRDPDSTTYTGAIETAEEFGLRIYTEAWQRGWEWASLRIVIADGAILDLESCRSTFSGSHSNRRSLSRPGALVGGRGAAVSKRFSPAETLDALLSAFARQRPHRASRQAPPKDAIRKC